MIETNVEVMNYFWLPKAYVNTCVSGADQNTVKRRSGEMSRTKDGYFENYVLPTIRNRLIPYSTDCKYLPKSKEYVEGFREVVNEALENIYAKRKGFVFNQEQLVEVLRFVPSAEVSFRDGIYFIWK
jgi:hypothetical protein